MPVMQIGWNQPDANPVTVCIQERHQECVLVSTAGCVFLKEPYKMRVEVAKLLSVWYFE